MNKKILLVIIIFMGLVILKIFVQTPLGWTAKLVSPMGLVIQKHASTPAPSPTEAPPNEPKTFQFDRSTDLKAELGKINPQVLDSDFE